MDDSNDKNRLNFKISENARKAKLNYLNSNIPNTFTTIWETITIEEEIDDGENRILKERIPFDLNELEQRPSTTDHLLFNSSRPSTSNDQFPSSTKSLSPKHLTRAAFNNKFRSNDKGKFKLDDNLECDKEACNDYNDANLNYLINDYDRFKNNRSLSPAELQLAKWKEIKRFKDQFRMAIKVGDNQNEKEQSIEQQSFYKQTSQTPDDYLNNNQILFSSSSDQSIDQQLPIENSDFYTSLDETRNTRFSDLDREEIDDKLVNRLTNSDNLDKNSSNDFDDNYILNVDQPIIKTPVIDEFTPRTSINSELNEHNFIDIDDNQLNYNTNYTTDYEQYFNDQTNQYNQLKNQEDNRENKKEIEEEFDRLLLDYPNIEKFVNNIISSTNSPLLNDNLSNSPAKSPNKSPFNSNDYDNQFLDKNVVGGQQQFKVPSEILEIEEPLIIPRTRKNQFLNQSVKRKSVIVQTSRPTSLLLSDSDKEIHHLLTIAKNNQLTNCVPVKDVYVINRTVHVIQKLSSFTLEFRNLLSFIRIKLGKKVKMNENQDQQKNKKANSSKWDHIKLVLKWIVANLFTTPGLLLILVSCFFRG